jgi:2-methylcitrate dehydratase
MSADALLASIADYALGCPIESAIDFESARGCLLESLASGFEALKERACLQLVGPLVPGAMMPGGARVPGTSLELDPVHAAFNIGTLVRWSDEDGSMSVREWGHPADCLGAILAVTDYLARRAIMEGRAPPRLSAVLTALLKAQEIQALALSSGGLADLGPTLRVRIASTAVAAALLGGTREQLVSALSHAWIDGTALPIHAHPSGRGARSRWAAADAASRGVRLALLAIAGDEGYPTALSAPGWGAWEILCGGQALALERPLGTRLSEERLAGRSAEERLRLLARFHCAVERCFPPRQAERIKRLFADPRRLDEEPVNELISALVANGAVR